MAERRMFAKSIIDSDLFLDMPATTQNLYFHLAMRADDDGFVNSPQKIMRMVSCSKNDFDMLVFKNFIIPFDTGICVIKHWRIHNYLRNDRYRPTIYTAEKNQLSLDESKSYTFGIPSGIPDDIPAGDTGKDRLGKDRLGEVRVGKEIEVVVPLHNPFKLFESEGFGTISKSIGERIGYMIDDYGERWVCEAMKEAVYYGKRTLPYVEGILKRWQTDGIDSPWEVKTAIGQTNAPVRLPDLED